jgi:quinol-cytochrome oxidoreductase complex cytochrome b subunit
MNWREIKFVFGVAAFIVMIGYSCFGEVDVLTGKTLSGLGLLVGLGLMAEHRSSEQKQ